jgi:hypothetical protein
MQALAPLLQQLQRHLTEAKQHLAQSFSGERFCSQAALSGDMGCDLLMVLCLQDQQQAWLHAQQTALSESLMQSVMQWQQQWRALLTKPCRQWQTW